MRDADDRHRELVVHNVVAHAIVRSRRKVATKIFEGDTFAVICGLRLAIRRDILLQLERFQRLNVSDAHYDCSEFAVPGHPDALTAVHGAPQHVRELTAKFASSDLSSNTVHD